MLRHDAYWLTVALAGHGLGLVVVAHVPLSQRAPRAVEPIPVESLAVLELRGDPSAEKAQSLSDSLQAPRQWKAPEPDDAVSWAATKSMAREDAPSSRLALEAPGRAEGRVPAEPPSAGQLHELSNDELGIGSRNVLLEGALQESALQGARAPSSEAPSPTARNLAPGIQESLRAAARDHDLALGLGSGGPLVGPLEDATRTSDIPWDSGATFDVFTDAAGHVTSIRITQASDGMEGWKRVARQVMSALGDRTLKVPTRAAGIVVTLRVTSQRLFPSGSRPRYAPRVADPSAVGRVARNIVPSGAPSGATAGSAEPAASASSQSLDILNVNPSVEDATPKPDSAVNVQLPAQRVNGVDVLKFGFDVTDVGARPMRVVHARIVDERPL